MTRTIRWFVALTLLGTLANAGGSRPGKGLASETRESRAVDSRPRLELLEYEFSSVQGEDGVWSAPNRVQGLRSRISAEGLEVFPRATSVEGQDAAWRLRLATGGLTRGERSLPLATPALSVDGARATLDRGPIQEWFWNRAQGVEQGWTIRERPAGAGEISILLDFGGGFEARVLSERVASFVRAGTLLAYGGLRAWDSSGRELEARFSGGPQGLAIVVDDEEALYPVTVDPILASRVDGNQVDPDFGSSVASAGDVNGDGYDDVLVGAPLYDNGQSDEGRAFLYLGSVTGLVEAPAWTAESNQASAWFGYSVAGAGDVNGDGFDDVIVGARVYSNGQGAEGRAYVYHGSASGLAATPAWTAESDQAGALFGTSVAGAGNVNGDAFDDVIVGADGYDNGESGEGRAYVYLGSASGLAASPAWTAESDDAAAEFGKSVAWADVDGDSFDDVIVGAPLFGAGNEGLVFVYFGSASGPSAIADGTIDNDWSGSWFGFSVASAGDVDADTFDDVIVGANQLSNGNNFEGAAYVHLGSGAGLGSAVWSVEGGQDGAVLGQTVSGAGDVNGDGYDDVIVGAFGYDHGESDEGRAYLYSGSATGPASTPTWTFESDQADAWFGTSVASAGDVNADGYGDVLVGALNYDDDQTDEGAVFLYLGVPDLVLDDDTISQTGGAFGGGVDFIGIGYSMTGIGDVNGDGVLDVAVGARVTDPGGAVWILLMNADGTVDDEIEIRSGVGGFTGTIDANDEFGVSLAAPGDLDGDDVPDLVVGAPGDGDGGTNRGAVWILYLNADGTVKSHNKISSTVGGFTGTLDNGDFFGLVEVLGDLDGSGPSTLALAVGALQDDDGGTDFGAVWILFLDSSETVISQAKISSTSGGLVGPGSDVDFGYSLANLGDLDGPGGSALALAVGSPVDDEAGTDAGALWVLFLTPSGAVASERKITTGLNGFGGILSPPDSFPFGFGISLANLGDPGGIGTATIAVGMSEDDTAGSNVGAVWILTLNEAGEVLGGEKITDGVHNLTGLAPDDFFGLGVGPLGDFDGDGRRDLLVGAVADGAIWLLLLNDGSISLIGATTWTGAVSSNWADPANWSDGVPNSTTPAIIPDAATTANDPVVSGNQSCDHLFIQAGGTLALGGGADNLSVFGGATLFGTGNAITGSGELVFARAGTLSGTATIALAAVSADEDLVVQGGPLVVTGDLSCDGDLWVRAGAEFDIDGDLFVAGNLVLDGRLDVGGSLDVNGGLIESVAEGGGGSGSLYTGGSGNCVEVGSVEFSGFANSACSLRVENPTPRGGPVAITALVFDLENGWANDVTIAVAGSITITTEDLAIGGSLTLEQGTLAIGPSVATLDVGGDLVIQAGTVTVDSDVQLDVGGGNGIVVESGALLDVTDRQMLVPMGIPIAVEGTLEIGPNGDLQLETSTVTVESGGTLRLAGDGSGTASLSGFGASRYTLDLQTGSTLAAKDFAFRQMDANGIVIGNGVTIAAAPLDLRRGLFDLPANNGVLLDVSRATPAEFRFLRFENSAAATGANNVHVPASSALITLSYWSGAFGGPAFEDDPGSKLDWGIQLSDGVLVSPAFAAPAPQLGPLELVVGSGGTYSDVGGALRALAGTQAGESVTLELAPGTHESFVLDGRELGFDLRLVGNPAARIDASRAPLWIANLSADRSIELFGLVIEGSTSAHPALIVEDADGVVLLDEVAVWSGARGPAVLLSNADAVVFQGGAIGAASTLGSARAAVLALERGSRASLSAVGVAAIELAGCSQLETRGLDVEPWCEPGSRWLYHGPAAVLDVNSSSGEMAIVSSAGTFAWLLVSPALGFESVSAKTEGLLLVDRTALGIGRARALAGGRGAWPIDPLPGTGPHYLQALVFEPLLGRFSLTDVRRVDRPR